MSTRNPLSIRNWPASERPRERLIEHGPQVLSDGELLAILIGCGSRGRTAVDLARQVLTVFGSLRDFLNADADKCLDQAGIGPARYAALQAALELARRHLRESQVLGAELSAPAVTHEFLVATLRDRPYEMFCCLYLDYRHRLLAFEEQDQTRISTALSEIARLFVHSHKGGRIEFELEGTTPPSSS